MSFTKVTSAGIGSTELVTLDSLEVINNASIGGVLTYEDVTNVDSVGIITARAGVLVGSGITLSKDGDVFFTGIATGNGSGLTALNASNLGSGTVPTARLGSGTASSSTFLRGDSTFAAVTSTTINNNADNRVITGSGTANTLNGESGLTYNGSSALIVSGSGQQDILIGSTNAGGAAIAFDGDSNGDGAGSDYALIRHNTDGNLEITTRNPSGATATIFKQGTTESMRIDSSGNVLIGTTTEGAASADNLTIAATDGETVGITLRSDTDEGARIFFSDGTSGTAEYEGVIGYDHTSNHMYFSTSASEKLRIDSAGRVMIGQTSSVVPFMITATASGFGGENTTGVFGDSTSYASGVGGGITLSGKYNSAGSQVGYAAIRGRKANGTDGNYDGVLTFAVRPNGSNMTERVRIGSDGRVLMGTNSFSNISSNSVLTLTQGSSSATRFNLTNSGSSTMESTQIFSQNNELAFTTSGSEALRIESDGFLKLKADKGLNFANQTITSTSNYNRSTTGEKLDYYEEGYLDPTAISSGLTWDTSSNRQLRYVRIGHWVSVSGYLQLVSRTSNNTVIQVAMPFTSAPNSSGYYTRGVGAVMYQNVTLTTNYTELVSYVGGGENYMRFFQMRSGYGWQQLMNSNLGSDSNTAIYFSINYMVA